MSNHDDSFHLSTRIATIQHIGKISTFQTEPSTNNNVATNELDSLPFATIDFADATDKTRHDGMVELVERMLGLHKSLSSAKTDHDKTLLQRQITATDNQIDKLVYELYGLSDDEIGIVEETT